MSFEKRIWAIEKAVSAKKLSPISAGLAENLTDEILEKIIHNKALTKQELAVIGRLTKQLGNCELNADCPVENMTDDELVAFIICNGSFKQRRKRRS